MRGGGKTGVKLERGPLGTYVAPPQMHTSSVILQEVVVARVSVKALIDCGATTSCCRRRWYQKYHVEVGPLMHDQIQVIGVENIPILWMGEWLDFH